MATGRGLFDPVSLDEKIKNFEGAAVKNNPFLSFVNATNSMITQSQTNNTPVSTQNDFPMYGGPGADAENDYWKEVDEKAREREKSEAISCSCFPFFNRKKKEVSITEAPQEKFREEKEFTI